MKRVVVLILMLMTAACAPGGGEVRQLYPTGNGVVAAVWEFQTGGQTAVAPYNVVEGGTSIALNNVNMTVMGDGTVFLSAVVLNQTGLSTFLNTVLTPVQSTTSMVVENGRIYVSINRTRGTISLEFDNDGNRTNDQTVSYQGVVQ